MHVGYKTLDQGPFKGPGDQRISVSCYNFPATPYVFNNTPVTNRLNPNYAAGLSAAEAARKYGPPGVMTEAYAKQIYTVEYSKDSLMWNLVPDWFYYFPTKFCNWCIVPKLVWLTNNVIIPLPIMTFLRLTAYHVALFIGAMEMVDIANSIIRKLSPLFEDESLLEGPLSLAEFRKKSKERKYGLFMEYEDFHPGYKPLFFFFRPIAWAIFAVDRYHLLPIWTRLTRFGDDIEVKTLTKSPYHMGMKVIVGGTRIRWPGYYGSIEKANVWLPGFVLGFVRDFCMAFATGNLYIFGWRV